MWFNQVHQFHPSNLGKKAAEALLATTAVEDLPINSCYGDGSPLEIEALMHIQDVYRQTMLAFPWHAGDLLLLDTILVAQGRMPFKGPRKIVVSMGETVWLKDLPAGGAA